MEEIDPVIAGFITDTVAAFKQFIADLLGVSDFEEVKTKWRLFKVFTRQLIMDISRFWKENIETLKLPEGVRFVIERFRGILAGVVVGGAVAGPLGAVAGGLAGGFGEEVGDRLVGALERLGDLLEKGNFNNPISNALPEGSLTTETERIGVD